MVFVLKKQLIYNIVFSVGLLLSCISFFAIVFNSDVSSTMAGTPLTGKVIVIDAGHGNPDGGALGISGSHEADINLKIAKKTGDFLQKCGAHVIYTRENNEAVADDLNDSIKNIKKSDMSNRKIIRDNSDADVFISIHMNIFAESKYSGAQVFYNNSVGSKVLAEYIQKSFKENVDRENNRNIKDAKNSIYILNNCTFPSVLVECGFISNPYEEKKLLSDDYQDKIAYAISSGIINFLTNI